MDNLIPGVIVLWICARQDWEEERMEGKSSARNKEKDGDGPIQGLCRRMNSEATEI